MSATQMYPSLWGGFPWFNVHEDRQGAYYSCYFPLYQLSSWLIYPLGKSIILVIGESPTKFTKWKIHLKVNIWERGGHRKKYSFKQYPKRNLRGASNSGKIAGISMLNVDGTILKKINASFNIHFYLAE